MVSTPFNIVTLLRNREMVGCCMQRTAKYTHNPKGYCAMFSALAEDCLVLPKTKAPVEAIGFSRSSSSSSSNNSDPFDAPYDCLNSDNVLSTIAIAFSPDGKTFATTHGDHTIKVFSYGNGKQIRQFHGHPRTPWTVKYHPINSNILASGCLGFDVRVWDIHRGILLNKMTYENSIISLAFHPSGQFIALASGPHLHTWDWREGMDRKYGGLPIGPPKTKQVLHTRNIRAVAFHPTGDYILAAAPDPPRQQEPFTPCRLYAFNFNTILQFSESECTDGAPPTMELWNLPTLVPQIHLYSDGGLDISQDGNFLVTCVILSFPPVYDDELWAPSGRLPRPQELVALPASMSMVSDDSYESNLLPPVPRGAEGALPPSLCGVNSKFEELFQQLNRLERRNAEDDDMSMRVSSGDGNSNKNRRVSRNLLRSAHKNLLELAELQAQDDAPRPSGHRPSLSYGSPMDVDARSGVGISASSAVFADQRGVPPSWKSTESLSVIKLNFENGMMVQPSLVRWRALSSTLMKAVTSVKFSPLARYALVGYGVRREGFVEDHPEPTVACELLSVCDDHLPSVSMVSDKEDVVNIAQFHPLSGRGLLYGTKRGKVRIFCRK